MRAFMGNLALALTWAALTGTITGGDLAVGFLIGYMTLWFAQPVVGRSNYFRKVRQVSGFLLFFVAEVVKANLRVAYDVVTPTYYMRPGVLAVPLEAKTDEEITALANLITLTPGTLSLDVSSDRKVLYIHAMFMDDPDEVRREIKEGFERRLLEVLR
jgi:multicomponent Na+:H+ antiporter subunit E